jgi:hypothetical protein
MVNKIYTKWYIVANPLSETTIYIQPVYYNDTVS